MEQHLLEAHPSPHRFPHLWLAITAVVVALAFIAMGFYASKIYQTRRAIDSSRQTSSANAAPAAGSGRSTAPSASPVPSPASSSATSQPGATSSQATSQAQQVSQDLKTVDLAEIKSSIGELKSVIGSF